MRNSIEFLIRIIPCFRRENSSNWMVRSKKKIIRRSVNRVIFSLELFVEINRITIFSFNLSLKFYLFIIASLIDIKAKNRFSFIGCALIKRSACIKAFSLPVPRFSSLHLSMCISFLGLSFSILMAYFLFPHILPLSLVCARIDTRAISSSVMALILNLLGCSPQCPAFSRVSSISSLFYHYLSCFIHNE